MKRIIECVPNFSEGRDMSVIKKITDRIESFDGVKLLDVDPGAATNRTVVTFIGSPEAVIEAAFYAIKEASEIIDMSKHKGAHPRFGGTDVCPLIPVSGITMEETVEFARKLAKRVGEELKIPVYCYEFAAYNEERKNLANCRSGEYEGLVKKLVDPNWKPDFGPAAFNPKTGAIAIGARKFLVAFNVNLNSTSIRRANAIAFDVREKGRKKELRSENGELRIENIPGTLKSVKAIGWFIEEYGVAQISMNLVDISVTPVHVAFDEVCEKARARGIRVTGSELVGVIPLEAMLAAGKYFLIKQQRSVGVSEKELIRIAVKSMGMEELKPFKPEEKIIEYMLKDKRNEKLINMTLSEFADETASESAAPGGGSVSALIGSIGVSLATMVANLSSHKRGWDERWEEFSAWAEKGQKLKNDLLKLVDEDTSAFNMIMEAFTLPKATDEEKKIRSEVIQSATKNAIEVPFKVMKTAYASFEVIEAMIETGNQNSLSDAGVGALCVRSGILGAYMNVKINASGLKDIEYKKNILAEGQKIADNAIKKEMELLEMVNEKLGN